MTLFSSTELNAFDSFLTDLVATDQSVLHPSPSLSGTTPCSTTTATTAAVSNDSSDAPPDQYMFSSPNTSIWADRQYPWTYRARSHLADRPSLMEKSKSPSIPYDTFRSYTSSDFDCAPHLPEYAHIMDVTRWTIDAGTDQLSARLETKETERLEANLTNLSTPAAYLVPSSPPVPPPPPVEPYIDSALSSSSQPTSAHIPAYAFPLSPAYPGLLTATQKRANHIHSEKKRRETIKKRTEALCGIVPGLRALCFIKEEQEEEAAGAAAAAMVQESLRDDDNQTTGKKRKKNQKMVGRRGRRSEEDRERLSFKIGGPKSEKIILIKTIEHLRTLQANRRGLLTRLNHLRQQGLSRGLPTDVLGTDRSSEWDFPWKMAEREDREDVLEEAA
ncbi:Myc-type, basic helix-loop-helix (bHLH) domain [Phaffia rhodozyma]|uniref:Myc-type, basic helix-loop-helix (BHLH) domain n=1 Tax=Phaffia rhodozyma TaxID=264483 RepID=A0A0F7SPE4_PHARH|nr:Myc-type, basic helix-loop-helix (bHLH) domain [Phaffia rhodozyma]